MTWATAASGCTVTALSERTAAYYAGIQQGFLSRGLMRTDPGAEIPLDAEKVTKLRRDLGLG